MQNRHNNHRFGDEVSSKLSLFIDSDFYINFIPSKWIFSKNRQAKSQLDSKYYLFIGFWNNLILNRRWRAKTIKLKRNKSKEVKSLNRKDHHKQLPHFLRSLLWEILEKSLELTIRKNLVHYYKKYRMKDDFFV